MEDPSTTAKSPGPQPGAGNIPCLAVRGRTVPEAWEKSVLELWERGVRVRTEYDREGDEPSRDSTMMISVEEPMAEPRIHLAFPGGIEELEKYRQEVLFGVHDSWIRPEEGKWTYTYHQRLSAYAPVADLSSSTVQSPFPPVDQIKYIIEKLSKSPHSRRAQGITWMPTADPATDDPPCLQRIWCRLLPIEEPSAVNREPSAGDDDARPAAHGSRFTDAKFALNMNSHWRSRDAYKAAFMNMYALTDLQRWLAEEIGKRMGEPVSVGRYVDISDSYHIYGAYFQEFNERFLKLVRERPFEKRVWRTDDRRVQAAIQAARAELAGKN
jgi:thymidylate synthase